jgi:hypothetical protein
MFIQVGGEVKTAIVGDSMTRALATVAFLEPNRAVPLGEVAVRMENQHVPGCEPTVKSLSGARDDFTLETFYGKAQSRTDAIASGIPEVFQSWNPSAPSFLARTGEQCGLDGEKYCISVSLAGSVQLLSAFEIAERTGLQPLYDEFFGSWSGTGGGVPGGTGSGSRLPAAVREPPNQPFGMMMRRVLGKWKEVGGPHPPAVGEDANLEKDFEFVVKWLVAQTQCEPTSCGTIFPAFRAVLWALGLKRMTAWLEGRE